MKTFFQELFEYNDSSNNKLITAMLENHTRLTEKSFNLLSHILNSHRIWNQKALPDLVPYKPWQLHPIELVQRINSANHADSIRIIDSIDLDTMVKYTLTSGQGFTNRLQDILFQIINHSTYHRAQIATEFRNSGLQPLLTDYIAYKMK